MLKGHGKGRSHRKFSQFGNMYFGHYELKEVQNPSNSFVHTSKNKKVVICMADFLDIGHYYYGDTGCGVFKRGGTKLERFLPKNQHTQRNLWNYEFWINGELPKFDF